MYARALGGRDQDTSDRPASHDQHARAKKRSSMTESVKRDRQRLGHRSLRKIERVRHRHTLARGYCDEFTKRSLHMRKHRCATHETHLQTLVRHPLHTIPARAAIYAGIYGNSFADAQSAHSFAERGHLARHFMAQHERLAHRKVSALALEVVREVRAANASCAHADQHLSWQKLRALVLLNHNLFRLVQYGCNHVRF